MKVVGSTPMVTVAAAAATQTTTPENWENDLLTIPEIEYYDALYYY